MYKLLRRAVLAVMAVALSATAGAQYVTLQGQLQGSNGTPLPNAVINFTPTQNFYVPATNTTQPVDNVYSNVAPSGSCSISGQLWTVANPTPTAVYECIYNTWTLLFSGLSAPLVLQHNGVNLANQATLNFSDTTPAAPVGSQNVIFQSDSLGRLSGYVSSPVSVNGTQVAAANFNGSSPAADASFLAATWKVLGSDVIAELPYGTNGSPGVLGCDGVSTFCSGGLITGALVSSQLQAQLLAPAAGQYIIVYPNAVTTTASGATYVTTNGSDRSAVLGATNYCSLGSGSATATWTGLDAGIAAAGVNPANVTAVYAFSVNANNYGPVASVCGPIGAYLSGPALVGFGALGAATGVANVTLSGTSPYVATQYSGQLSGLTSANFPSASISATVTVGGGGFPGAQAQVPLVGWFVYYTGTPVSQGNPVQVEPPLSFDATTNTLSLTAPLDAASDTGAVNAYAASVPWLSATYDATVKIIPAHTSTSATPSFALNGGPAMTIVGPTGAPLLAGDLSINAPATLVFGPNHTWFLQNPQTSGYPRGAALLTASLPACGASTLLQRLGVTDATSATPGAAPTGGGTYTVPVVCIYNSTGTVYSWVID